VFHELGLAQLVFHELSFTQTRLICNQHVFPKRLIRNESQSRLYNSVSILYGVAAMQPMIQIPWWVVSWWLWRLVHRCNYIFENTQMGRSDPYKLVHIIRFRPPRSRPVGRPRPVKSLVLVRAGSQNFQNRILIPISRLPMTYLDLPHSKLTRLYPYSTPPLQKTIQIFHIFRLYPDLFRLWCPNDCILLIARIEMSPKTLKKSKQFSQKLKIIAWCYVGQVCISAVCGKSLLFAKNGFWRPVSLFCL
jgi:hypothetical protein